MDDEELSRGTPEFIGRFRVERELGSGGFCVVYLAHDPNFDSPVAIKMLAERWTSRLDVRERFVQEGRLLRHAQSPRVVPVHEFIEPEDGRPYLVMEYAAGGSVEAELERAEGQLRAGRALRLAAEAAWAVADMHERDVLHRDIKPANFLLATDGSGTERVLITDFGLAKRLAEASGLTQTVGTAGYMAPEQDNRNAEPDGLDKRADVYGLGALTYHLVTGRKPTGPAEEITALGDLRPDLLPKAAAMVMAALSRDRERRPATAKALAEVLDAAASQLGAPPLAGGPSGQVAKRRLARALTVAVVAVFITAAVTAVTLWPQHDGTTAAGSTTTPTTSSTASSTATSTTATSTAPTTTLTPTSTPTTAPTKPPSQTPPPIEAQVASPTFNDKLKYRVTTPVNGACIGYRKNYVGAVQTRCDDGEPFTIITSSSGFLLMNSRSPGTCLAPSESQSISTEGTTEKVPCEPAKPTRRVLWSVEQQENGFHRIQSTMNASMCLTAKSSSKPPSLNGQPTLRFYQCAAPDTNNGKLQRWTIESTG